MVLIDLSLISALTELWCVRVTLDSDPDSGVGLIIRVEGIVSHSSQLLTQYNMSNYNIYSLQDFILNWFLFALNYLLLSYRLKKYDILK